MSPVDVHNDWDPLEGVIIGTIVGARVPSADLGLHAISFSDCATPADIPSGRFPTGWWSRPRRSSPSCATRSAGWGSGSAVRSPGTPPPPWRRRTGRPTDTSTTARATGFLTIGNTIIETPMVLRSRFLEPFAYKNPLLDNFCGAARWISAPKSRLADTMYDPTASSGSRLLDREPAFDAANVLRFGTDMLYLVSDSDNELGRR